MAAPQKPPQLPVRTNSKEHPRSGLRHTRRSSCLLYFGLHDRNDIVEDAPVQLSQDIMTVEG